MNPIPYGRQHITAEDLNAVTETLQSDFLTQGPKIAEFEKAFATYIGAKYAVAVSNGTAALHLAAMALGVNENSNVITTPITFAASANCVVIVAAMYILLILTQPLIFLNVNKVEALIQSKLKVFSGNYPG